MRVLGSGPAGKDMIMFLHGAGLSGEMWKPQMERLPEYRCLAPDLPEHGSEPGREPFSLDLAASQVKSLITHEGGDGASAHIVGISLGGAVALHLMGKHPECVRTVIVSGTSGKISPAVARIINLNTIMYRVLSPEQVAGLMLLQFGIPSEYRSTLSLACRRMTARAVSHISHALVNFELPVDQDKPLLVMVGEKETILAKQAARRIVSHMRSARGVTVLGAGHVWNLQHPDLFSKVVSAFARGEQLPDSLVPF